MYLKYEVSGKLLLIELNKAAKTRRAVTETMILSEKSSREINRVKYARIQSSEVGKNAVINWSVYTRTIVIVRLKLVLREFVLVTTV